MADQITASARPSENREAYEALKAQSYQTCSDAEWQVFLALAERMELDPFARQVMMLGGYDKKQRREVFRPYVTIDGQRLIAERTGRYEGQTPITWCGADGVWRDVWLENSPPLAARVGVYKSGFREPLYSVARYSSYVGTYYHHDSGSHRVSPTWEKMPDLMIGKVAEALSLRRAFPQELSGVYAPEEMEAVPLETVSVSMGRRDDDYTNGHAAAAIAEQAAADAVAQEQALDRIRSKQLAEVLISDLKKVGDVDDLIRWIELNVGEYTSLETSGAGRVWTALRGKARALEWPGSQLQKAVSSIVDDWKAEQNGELPREERYAVDTDHPDPHAASDDAGLVHDEMGKPL